MIGLNKHQGKDLLAKKVSHCKYCNVPISWVATPSKAGKDGTIKTSMMPISIPTEADLRIVLTAEGAQTAYAYRQHWRDCPGANEARNARHSKNNTTQAHYSRRPVPTKDETQHPLSESQRMQIALEEGGRQRLSTLLMSRIMDLLDKHKGDHKGPLHTSTMFKIQAIGYTIARVDHSRHSHGNTMDKWALVGTGPLLGLHRMLDKLEGAARAQTVLAYIADYQRLADKHANKVTKT